MKSSKQLILTHQGQVVIAGNILAVERAIEIAKLKGAKRAILTSRERSFPLLSHAESI